MELNCISDRQKNILIKALEERQRVLDELISHHREDIEEQKAKGNDDYVNELRRELNKFETERGTVDDLITDIDVATICSKAMSYEAEAVENIMQMFRVAQKELIREGEKATGKTIDSLELREDSRGGIGLYAVAEDGDVYSPFYDQSGDWEGAFNVDPEDTFKEELALISLAGATDWSEWEWVKQ